MFMLTTADSLLIRTLDPFVAFSLVCLESTTKEELSVAVDVAALMLPLVLDVACRDELDEGKRGEDEDEDDEDDCNKLDTDVVKLFELPAPAPTPLLMCKRP
jgi:hypothetical protein